MIADRQTRQALLLIFLLGLLLGAIYAVTYKMNFDIRQMLNRGFQFVENNNIIFFDNVFRNGVGDVPGGLMSVFVGVPMKVWNSPFAALAFLSFLHAIGFFLLLDVLKNYFSSFVLILFAVLFWLSPWRVSETYLWNPSYLFFTTALHFWSAHRMKDKAQFWSTFCHGGAILMMCQIQSSSVILIIATIILIWKKSIKVHWGAALAAGLIGAASYVPYLIASWNEPYFSLDILNSRYFIFRGLIYIFPILKSLWYWARFTGGIFPKPLFQNVDFSWLFNENQEWFFEGFIVGIAYFFGVITTLYSINMNFVFFRRHLKMFNLWKYKVGKKTSFLTFYVVVAFISMIIGAALAPIDLIYWHLIILYPIAIIPILYYMEERKEFLPIRTFTVVLVVYFSMYNLIYAIGSGKHSIYEAPHEAYIQLYYPNRNN